MSAVVFDLDGVLRIGSAAVPGANDAVKMLTERGIPFMICTNECRYVPSQIAQMLHDMGVEIPPATPIYTAGLAVRDYLQSKIDRKEALGIGIVGEQGLHHVLSVFGDRIIEEPMQVVNQIGNHPTQQYLKQYLVIGTLNEHSPPVLDKIRKWIHAGAVVITSCCDLSDPSAATMGMPNALLQMCGFRATPYTTGKPHPIWARAILSRFPGYAAHEILFVGDTLYTDIRLAEESGFQSALVLCGNTTREALKDSVVSPDHVIESVAALSDLLDRINSPSHPPINPHPVLRS